MNSQAMRILCGLLLVLAQGVHAQDEDDIEGMSGTLNVLGALHESPCNLEMASLHQTIDLDAVSTNQLQRPGDQANAKTFQLRFANCQRTAGRIRNERTGNLTWSAYQPVVTVAFSAPADADDPRLVKVKGITGMGLQLSDSLGRDVQLGSRGQPLFLPVGQSTQTWNIRPTRTSAPLTSGAFRALVEFRLNYE